MVPSYHPDLVLGVATYAAELFQVAGELDAVYVPVGLGSGISGLIGVRDLLGLRTEVIGVVAKAAPATALSVTAGRSSPPRRPAPSSTGWPAGPRSRCHRRHPKGASGVLTVTEEAGYAKERVRLGRPIGEFQLVQEKLARTEVARLNVENLVFRYLEDGCCRPRPQPGRSVVLTGAGSGIGCTWRFAWPITRCV